MKLISRIALALAGMFAGLLLIEVLLRLTLPANPFSPMFPLFPNTKMIMDVGYPGASPRATVSTNKWGLRGDNPPANWTAARTLLTVGGSTTRETFLDDQKTWSALLQAKLRTVYPDVWVGNAGIDGQTTRAHKLLMSEVIAKIKPDMVVFLIGINDLGLSLRDDRKEHGIAADRPRSRRWRILLRSRLAQILYDWKRVLIDKVAVVQTRPIDPLKPLTQPMPLPKDLSTLLPLRDEYRANIQELIRQCRELGIRPFFLTQPMLYEDTPEWRKIEGSYYWIEKTSGRLSAATHWKLLTLYNTLLLETCREEKVDCFDLAAVVPHKRIYFVDSVHYTERGSELVAEKVAGFLKERIDN